MLLWGRECWAWRWRLYVQGLFGKELSVMSIKSCKSTLCTCSQSTHDCELATAEVRYTLNSVTSYMHLVRLLPGNKVVVDHAQV